MAVRNNRRKSYKSDISYFNKDIVSKVIEKSLSDEIRRWLGMTKVGKIICDEINEKIRETEIRCDVKALYEYKNFTIEQIAKEKNLSVDSVIEYLKASGIKIA